MQSLGKPYDTLDEVIGIRENASSLKAFGIEYKEIDLKENEFDISKIIESLQKDKIKLIHIQRSKGYSTRKSLKLDQIENVIKEIRKVDKDVIIFIDNCYCEFVERKTPLEVGADIIVGSLIKNLGGGIATNRSICMSEKKNIYRLWLKGLIHQVKAKKFGPSLRCK